jgi:hypothetical protein
VGTFVRGAYTGSQQGSMQFICVLKSGSSVWFLGTDYTVGTPYYNKQYNCKGINNDSLAWSDACACSWIVKLFLKSGVVVAENCKIPTYNEINMINQGMRCNGFSYWTSTRYDDSYVYRIGEEGAPYHGNPSILTNGIVPFVKISL